MSDIERLRHEILVELATCNGKASQLTKSADGEFVAYFGRLRIALDPQDFTDQHGCVLCRSVDMPNPPPETPKKAP